MPPAVIAGRYELLSELGRGSMGTVWRARDLRFDRQVAIKMVRLGTTSAGFGPHLGGRFEREIRAVGRLNHPNIAIAYDAGTTGDQMYLVTELVSGQSLAELLRERHGSGRGPFPIDAALDIAAQVCAGLAVAHRAGVVHRDLKPANLMVSDAAEVKIVDFGIARLVEDTLPRLTQPGTMVGTLAYGSPEQLEGKVVDGRSDLYALGCMLYELIAGGRPFVATDAESLMRLHIFATATPLTQRRPDTPPGVAALVAQLMAKHPDQRPPRAEDVLARIDDLRNPVEYRSTQILGYGQLPPQPRDVVVPPSQERSTILVGEDPPRGYPPPGQQQPGRHQAPDAYPPQGQYTPAGPYQPPGQYPPQGSYQQPGQYAPGQYPPPGQQPPAPYQPPAQYQPPGQYSPPGQDYPPYQDRGPTPSPAAVAAWRGDRPEIIDAQTRARYRLYWLLTAGLAVIAVGAVALLVLTGNKSGLSVTSVSIPAPKAATCDGTVDVTANVVTNTHGGTITYQWFRSDGQTQPKSTVDVPAGATSTPIHFQWTFHGKATFKGTATLKILSPGSASAETPVNYTCH